MSNSSPSPRNVAAAIGMAKVNYRLKLTKDTSDRRNNMRRNGCSSILTRAELAARVAK